MDFITFNHNQKSTRSCGNHGLARKRGPLAAALLALTAVAALLTNCGRPRHDSRLERIAAYVSDNPERAIASLDSIDASELDDPDRAFHDLLTIKARDKAYITHTSDSLIRCVIEYYTRHDDSALTPEALYYGGRVYSDLGDYPTSLSYFQQALELLPEGTHNLILRGNALSQTGGLLIDLGMLTQSISYIKEVMEINIRTKDTLNLAYNNRMLGAAYTEMEMYDSAEFYFRRSLAHLKRLPRKFGIETQVYQAANKYERGDIDSALLLIRPAIDNVGTMFESYTLAYASKIYLKANIPDSAYIFSHRLATDSNLDNRKTGYKVMLSPQLRGYVPADSLDLFFSDYKAIMEEHFHNRQSEETLIQNSRYNYQIHDRERRKAEIKSRNLAIALLSAMCIILALVSAATIFYARNRNKIIELRRIIDSLNKIKESLNNKGTGFSATQTEDDRASVTHNMGTDCPKPDNDKITEQSLKEEIRGILENIKHTSSPCGVPETILSSEPYIAIRKYIAEKDLIPNSEEHIWHDLEKIVLTEYPEFLNRLQLLLGGAPDEQNLRIALLIKCGVTAAQASRLLGRSRSTVSYRRMAICVKILGTKSEIDYLDDVVRAL